MPTPTPTPIRVFESKPLESPFEFPLELSELALLVLVLALVLVERRVRLASFTVAKSSPDIVGKEAEGSKVQRLVLEVGQAGAVVTRTVRELVVTEAHCS
jgi:hypothetical protein